MHVGLSSSQHKHDEHIDLSVTICWVHLPYRLQVLTEGKDVQHVRFSLLVYWEMSIWENIKCLKKAINVNGTLYDKMNARRSARSLLLKRKLWFFFTTLPVVHMNCSVQPCLCLHLEYSWCLGMMQLPCTCAGAKAKAAPKQTEIRNMEDAGDGRQG